MWRPPPSHSDKYVEYAICKNNYITPISFPEYKDLDNTQKFTLPTIENIHTSILDIIHKLKNVQVSAMQLNDDKCKCNYHNPF